MEVHGGSLRQVKTQMGKMKKQLWSAATALVVVAGVSLLAHAQPMSFGKATKIRFPDFYDPPNQSKLRVLLQGSEAVPDGKSRFIVKDVSIESYRVTGELESVVEAPNCTYDLATRTASSVGLIKGRTADGQLRFEGVGFSISLTNKALYISNFNTVFRDIPLATQKK